ncbi:MAG: hypothetical protein CL840_09870 [Crocinitomicaceae bacterium]|nr:hypothetical protein [Crocinitomicaceae bacterium]|tara:strand:+ start:11828 stop:12856 length:1029 start_codon:yes stop_codon:yes gene_type:complete
MSSSYKILKTKPGQEHFDLFYNLPKKLYPQNSQRFILGHDPVKTHLEGCYVLLDSDKAIGRFAFYENENLMIDGQFAACIGSYECVNDPNASHALLDNAKRMAQLKGYDFLIGPMEGSTWNNHRFSMDNDQPNFFMEPYHHAYYNQHFIDFGFSPISQYFSNLDEELNVEEERLKKFEQMYLNQGAVFRNLNLNDLENELYKIATFSLKAFSANFLFTPITTSEFVSKYLKIKSLIDPELVWIVEDKLGEIQAFIFSIPDHYDSIKPSKTLIIKSMARKRTSPFKGIGSYLAGKTVQIAKEQGYEKVIHAFMINDNASRLISEKYAKGSGYHKNYPLYGLKL